jgi:hypothetical protein
MLRIRKKTIRRRWGWAKEATRLRVTLETGRCCSVASIALRSDDLAEWCIEGGSRAVIATLISITFIVQRTCMAGTARFLRHAPLVRGANTGGANVDEVTDVDAEIGFEPGDAIYHEDNIVHTARIGGEDAAVVNATVLLTSGEPLLIARGPRFAGGHKLLRAAPVNAPLPIAAVAS